MDVWDVIVAFALPKSQDNSSSGDLMRTCKSSPERAMSAPSWTSHRRPTAFTALGAQGAALGGNGARLARCDLRAQLRVAIRGRLIILRSRNGDEATGCGLSTARSRGAWATWRMCHNEENSALRGPSRLWHGSETRLGPCTNSDRARR